MIRQGSGSGRSVTLSWIITMMTTWTWLKAIPVVSCLIWSRPRRQRRRHVHDYMTTKGRPRFQPRGLKIGPLVNFSGCFHSPAQTLLGSILREMSGTMLLPSERPFWSDLSGGWLNEQSHQRIKDHPFSDPRYQDKLGENRTSKQRAVVRRLALITHG